MVITDLIIRNFLWSVKNTNSSSFGMVKLTPSLVSCRISKTSFLHGDERKEKNPDNLIKKLSHLRLHNQNIDSIEDISACKNLSVLYLHNNCLRKINNLHCAANLTHLYLQNNKIEKLENLESARKLKKLYLGRNCIGVVEGLENMQCLQELHVEKQRLPPGECVYFDPRSVAAIANSLRVLNVSRNNLTSLADLTHLRQIEHFIARDNKLYNVKDIADAIKQWTCIGNMEFQGNPVCLQHRYRVTVIAAASSSLASLDGKNVTDTSRQFLKQLSKTLQERASSERKEPPMKAKLYKEVESLGHNLPPFLTQTISRSVLKDSLVPEVTTILPPVRTSLFPAWNPRRAKDTSLRKTSHVGTSYKMKQQVMSERKQVKISSNLSQI